MTATLKQTAYSVYLRKNYFAKNTSPHYPLITPSEITAFENLILDF
jgi:hypothetical protein